MASTGAITNRRLFAPGRNDDFLEDKLDHIGDGLAQAPQAKTEKTDPVRPQPALYVADNLAFRVSQVSDTQEQGK